MSLDWVKSAFGATFGLGGVFYDYDRDMPMMAQSQAQGWTTTNPWAAQGGRLMSGKEVRSYLVPRVTSGSETNTSRNLSAIEILQQKTDKWLNGVKLNV